MKLYHYSDKIINDLDINYLYQDHYIKPKGFWISVDGPNDWREWCESEDFHLERLKFKHEIILNKNSNILHLKNDNEIIKFNEDYSIGDMRLYNHKIKWDELRNEYGGILIVPYSFNLRLDINHHWYYGWDCASGCIWDISSIDKIELCK